MDQQAPEGPGFEKVSEESYYQIVVVLSLFVVDFGFDTNTSNKRQKIEINKQKWQKIERVACNVVLHQAFFSTSQPFQACISARILLREGVKKLLMACISAKKGREGVKKLSVACISAKVFVVVMGVELSK